MQINFFASYKYNSTIFVNLEKYELFKIAQRLQRRSRPINDSKGKVFKKYYEFPIKGGGSARAIFPIRKNRLLKEMKFFDEI